MSSMDFFAEFSYLCPQDSATTDHIHYPTSLNALAHENLNTPAAYMQPPLPPAHQPSVGRSEAIAYVQEVKRQLSGKPETFKLFLAVLKDFQCEFVDNATAIQRIWSLFRGHPDLIEGFNAFLPPSSRIRRDSSNAVGEAVPMLPHSGNNRELEALAFIQEVQQQLIAVPDVHNKFMAVLKAFSTDVIDMTTAIQLIAQVFRGYPDLIARFITFVAPDYRTENSSKSDPLTPDSIR